MGVRQWGGLRGLPPVVTAVGLAVGAAFAAATAGAQRQPGSVLLAAGAPPAVVPANRSAADATISGDGRFVVFGSCATNLVGYPVAGGPCALWLRDLVGRTTEPLPVRGGGGSPAISADGRFVAFWSEAPDLIPGETIPCGDRFCRNVFEYNRVTGTTELMSVNGRGVPGNASSGFDDEGPAISADGRFVAFESLAHNLVPGDTNDIGDVFVHDRAAGTTERVDVSSSGAQANNGSWAPSISADGRFVAFESNASNLVPGDTNDVDDIFVRDRLTGTTERVDVSSTGEEADGSVDGEPSISADGRFVAFRSFATNLVANDTNGIDDVFVRDRQRGTTERVSVSSSGEQVTSCPTYFDDCNTAPAISADGRFVAFLSGAPNLVAGGGSGGVVVRDRRTATTERVSSVGRVSSGGPTAISADGRFVAFDSVGQEHVAGYRRICTASLCPGAEVFLRDRNAGTTTLVSIGLDLQPRAGQVALRPWPARAGHRLAATMPVSAATAPLATARVACTATLAGRRLPPAARDFRAGSARCTWKIPPRTRGERLTASLVATGPNGTVRKYFVGTIH